jgi:hypothetical protein
LLLLTLALSFHDLDVPFVRFLGKPSGILMSQLFVFSPRDRIKSSPMISHDPGKLTNIKIPPGGF